MSLFGKPMEDRDRVASFELMKLINEPAKMITDTTLKTAGGIMGRDLVRVSVAFGLGISAVHTLSYYSAKQEEPKLGSVSNKALRREALENAAFVNKHLLIAGMALALMTSHHPDGGDALDVEQAMEKAKKLYTALEDHGAV